ncbi:RluA family pseudouridine synthase [uncultured Enterovirga sp.]|uniref:RluA family pseudouridine synthase n=1 Tax=uncultured Enterovirga sp. TaxID=2026352 RepID=UPI0035CB097E
MTERVLNLATLDRPGRLDRALAEAWPDLSRSRLQALIRDGHVTVNDAVVSNPAARSAAGTVLLREPDPIDPAPMSEAIPLEIVFEDAEVIVIDKPVGLVVHPGAGHDRGTLVNALIGHCGASLSGIGGVRRPGIVHRLDKDTSGLLVVAKTDRAHQSLAEQFADHGRNGPLERAYLAFVWGVPEPKQGLVEVPLARSSTQREKIAVATAERGRHALTRYRVEAEFRDGGGETVASLLRCTLSTGRTHQIRVHMAHLRHPLIGDALYGSGYRTKSTRLEPEARAVAEELGRQALHATLLQFSHPTTGEIMRFESDLPADLARLRAALEG